MRKMSARTKRWADLADEANNKVFGGKAKAKADWQSGSNEYGKQKKLGGDIDEPDEGVTGADDKRQHGSTGGKKTPAMKPFDVTQYQSS